MLLKIIGDIIFVFHGQLTLPNPSKMGLIDNKSPRDKIDWNFSELVRLLDMLIFSLLSNNTVKNNN